MEPTYLIALLAVIANSILIAALPHPGDDPSFAARFLRAMGRLAVLRFSDSRGTLHLPGTAQPDPYDDDPKMRLPQVPRMPRNVEPIFGPRFNYIALTLAFGVLGLFGCATPAQTQARRDLGAALDKSTSSVQAFVRWDKERQAEITKSASSYEAGQRALLDHRLTRAQTVQQIVRAHLTLEAALRALDAQAVPAIAPSRDPAVRP